MTAPEDCSAEHTFLCSLVALFVCAFQAAAALAACSFKANPSKTTLLVQHPSQLFLQVQEDASRSVTVSNKGKYPVDIRWHVEQERLRRHFTLEPPTATIAPGASQSVSVTFNKEHKLKTQMKLLGAAVLHCQVVEPLTGAQEAALPVKVRWHQHSSSAQCRHLSCTCIACSMCE